MQHQGVWWPLQTAKIELGTLHEEVLLRELLSAERHAIANEDRERDKGFATSMA